LNAALDVELEIDRDGDLRTMRVTKSRDGSDSQPAFCYRFHSRQLGIDNHGDPVTAVVVEHLADEDIAKRGKRHSAKARASLNCLWECIKDRTLSWSLQSETAMRYTLMNVWEEACVKQGVLSNSPDIKQRRRMFRQAVEELEEAGAIVIDSENRERVYPAPKQPTGEPG
jgi:hypothetical protein